MLDESHSLDDLLNILQKDAEPNAQLPGTTPNEMIKAQARSVAKEKPNLAVQTTAAPTQDDPTEQANNILQKILRDFEMVGTEVLDKWRADRDQIQTVIDILLPVVRTGGDVPRVYVEVLGQLLDTKANTALTAVKFLDAKTRLLATTKSQILINNTIQTPSAELEQILAEPMDDDFRGGSNGKK